MFKELDDYLSVYLSDDYWYDEGFSIAQEMLLKFPPRDWEELSNEVLNKPIEWQRKLAYCLHNESSMDELNMLLKLLSTDDEELFEICIDSLRSFTSTESKKLILKDLSIPKRIYELISNSGDATKKVFEAFWRRCKADDIIGGGYPVPMVDFQVWMVGDNNHSPTGKHNPVNVLRQVGILARGSYGLLFTTSPNILIRNYQSSKQIED